MKNVKICRFFKCHENCRFCGECIFFYFWFFISTLDFSESFNLNLFLLFLNFFLLLKIVETNLKMKRVQIFFVTVFFDNSILVFEIFSKSKETKIFFFQRGKNEKVPLLFREREEQKSRYFLRDEDEILL
jgi:hypothetical protein